MSAHTKFADGDLETGDGSPTNHEEVAVEPVTKGGKDMSPGAVAARRWVLRRAVCGEFVATFIFLFVAISQGYNNSRAGLDNPSHGAISVGFCAVAVIFSFADVSGAHFNPAVTFATVVTRKMSIPKGLMYLCAQLSASILSNLAIFMVFPGVTEPDNLRRLAVTPAADVNPIQSILMEAALTFILVYVIFAVAFDEVDANNVKVVSKDESGKETSVKTGNLTIYTTGGHTKNTFAPFAIGLTLGFLCTVGGSVSGGAFNPARVFGSAICTGVWEDHYVYWIGDLGGAAAAGLLHGLFSVMKTKTKEPSLLEAE
mmetsp:Transcript_23030/g.53843  ORF Transcript_23030/g.53843 Transcript_23030/m.53843 type:complete len:314 (+) Transcript_23030:61-1002(+)|eukprot:CAMPEP_0114564346 /NCGR_PEP_ID=MMETSP0114-20121206/13664_1 /TAXON_ID=31324 /ORGANISM="Goniomonas sp, Strain m" /LENGTH=313 /DNA_ID=CAMNT_0001750393 /DNA_START=59 /DNA_END=1000 /DNA_ORIENTATION=+